MTDEPEKLGLKAAVNQARELIKTAAAEDLDAFQLPLIPVGDQDGVATGAGAALGEEAPDGSKRKPGRPPGSRNKRTDEWVSYLLSKYQSPLVTLAETYSRPVAVLAAELGCDAIEAFRLQIAAAKELAPYLHQKLPLAVQIDGKGDMELTINLAPELARAMEADDEGGYTFEGEAVEIEE